MATLDPARILRLIRERSGLSQRELAERAGTSQSVIARIEGGRPAPERTRSSGNVERFVAHARRA